MPRDWTATTLGECADFFSGGTPRKSNASYWGGSVPWFSGKDLKKFYLSDSEDHVTEEGAKDGSRLMPAGSILLLVRGMTLHNDVPIGVLKREATFNQDIKALRAKSGVQQSFLAHWLVSQKPRLLRTVHAAGHGTGVLATDRLQALELELPPPDEQAAIANVFDLIEQKIEQNRRTGRSLEELARATFKAWFVDFEPVKARAAGQTSFPGMPPAAFAALADRLTDSPLGAVPEGWGVLPLSAVCHIVSGGTPKRSETNYWGGEIPWYSVKDAPPDGMPWVHSTNEQITQAGLEGSAAALVPGGCTIISARGTVGRLALAARPMAFNQSCYGLLPEDGKSFRHLYLLLRQVVGELQQRTHGSVFDTITRQTFDGVYVTQPPSMLLQYFEQLVAPLFDLLLASLKESLKLSDLRDYLLPKLLSGDVTVHRA